MSTRTEQTQKNRVAAFAMFIVLMAVFPLASKAQEYIEIKGATGVGVLAGRISEEAARQDAINKAKLEALRMAGITEHLQSYELLFTSETDHDYSQFFSSDVHSEMQGTVVDVDIVSETRSLNPRSNLFEVEVTINAIVVKYDTRPDPAFNTRVTGIHAVYNNGDTLTFRVFSTLDAHLHIFNINDNEAYLMYPNPWEESKIIEAGSTKRFPFGLVDYVLEKQTRTPEENRLIFVFTKQPVRFLDFINEAQETYSENIFKWIYSISPDMRHTNYQTFTIR